MAMGIRRRHALTPREFLTEHLMPSVPVIVTGEMHAWEARRSWSFDSFARRFGDRRVPIYGDYFGPTSFKRITSLGEFLASTDRGGSYVRWFTLFQDLPERQRRFFPWSDSFFDEVTAEWAHPSFLPDHSYLLPFCSSEHRLDFTRSSPATLAKALYMSPVGSQTRLHKDPWGTDAVILQFSGRKYAKVWPPAAEPYLTRTVAGADEPEVVVVESPDPVGFPDFAKAGDPIEGWIEPGDIIYLPAGWYHHVVTVEDSISITWNFTHQAAWPTWHKLHARLPVWQQSDINYILHIAPNRLAAPLGG